MWGNGAHAMLPVEVCLYPLLIVLLTCWQLLLCLQQAVHAVFTYAFLESVRDWGCYTSQVRLCKRLGVLHFTGEAVFGEHHHQPCINIKAWALNVNTIWD